MTVRWPACAFSWLLSYVLTPGSPTFTRHCDLHGGENVDGQQRRVWYCRHGSQPSRVLDDPLRLRPVGLIVAPAVLPSPRSYRRLRAQG